jgi:YggT family protein
MFVRILLSWFSFSYSNRVYGFLCGLTDPYLDYFRRLRFLRFPMIDLSPIAALAVLNIASNITGTISRLGSISVVFAAMIFAQAIWSVLSFVIGFFGIALVVRYVGMLASVPVRSPFWATVDSFTYPIIHRISRMFFSRRAISYKAGITASIAVFAVAYLIMFKVGIAWFR